MTGKKVGLKSEQVIQIFLNRFPESNHTGRKGTT
jgi:hypothetical protein